MTDPREAARGLPALAARAQLGDRAALEGLLRRLQPALADHIRSIVRDDALAADVLQDTLIIVATKLSSVRQTEWVRAWAYRVATRAAIRAARSRSREQSLLIEELPEIPAAEPEELSVDTDRLLAELAHRLATLPFAAQLVVRMHYLESLTQLEISEALEIPLGTVKSRLAYGLTCLRRSMAPGSSC